MAKAPTCTTAVLSAALISAAAVWCGCSDDEGGAPPKAEPVGALSVRGEEVYEPH